MPCTSKCFFKEERIPGEGGCFLGLPGPMEVCQGYKAPVTVNPAPLDPELAGKFDNFNMV